MVNREYEEVNGDAYRLPGPAVYSPREVAHVLCRVRNDWAYRSLLGGGVRRHGSKGGKERKKKEKVKSKMGLRQACCGESEEGGGRKEEGGGGRTIHVGVLKGNMARRETIGGHLLAGCGRRGRPVVAVDSERSEIGNIDGIQVLVTGLFFPSLGTPLPFNARPVTTQPLSSLSLPSSRFVTPSGAGTRQHGRPG